MSRAQVHPRDASQARPGEVVAELVVVVDGEQVDVVPLSAEMVDFWIFKLATARCLGHAAVRALMRGEGPR